MSNKTIESTDSIFEIIIKNLLFYGEGYQVKKV